MSDKLGIVSFEFKRTQEKAGEYLGRLVYDASGQCTNMDIEHKTSAIIKLNGVLIVGNSGETKSFVVDYVEELDSLAKLQQEAFLRGWRESVKSTIPPSMVYHDLEGQCLALEYYKD